METTVLSSAVTFLEALPCKGARRVTSRLPWGVFTPEALQTRGTELLRQTLLPVVAGPKAVKGFLLHPSQKKISR